MTRKRSEDEKREKSGRLNDGIAPHQPYAPVPTITGFADSSGRLLDFNILFL